MEGGSWRWKKDEAGLRRMEEEEEMKEGGMGILISWEQSYYGVWSVINIIKQNIDNVIIIPNNNCLSNKKVLKTLPYILYSITHKGWEYEKFNFESICFSWTLPNLDFERIFRQKIIFCIKTPKINFKFQHEAYLG